MNAYNEQEGIPLGYDRVTDVLSPYKRFDGVDPTVLANACERGKQVHNFCELYALNLLIETPNQIVKPYFDSFRKWFDTWVDEVFLCETRINDSGLKLSGQFDLLCKLKYSRELVIVDYKTPLNCDKTWQLQMSAYYTLIVRNTDFWPDRAICLKLDSDGRDAIATEYKNLDSSVEIFLKQLEVYRFFNRKVNAK